MRLFRKLAAVALSVVVVLGGLYATGVVGPPSAGLKDSGDWGEVTEERTEIVTTLWVNNPNPVGLSLGNLQADYQVQMNGVTVAKGQKDGVSVEKGNNTKELSTYVQNDEIQPWWVEYVRANETITMRASGEARVGTPLGEQTVQFPAQKRTMMDDATPVISALSAAASELEGDYSRRVTLNGQEVSAGYEIRRAWAEWGSVSENQTTVLIKYRVHNPGDVPLPAVPDGMQMDVEMNDVQMFSGGADEMEPRDADRDAVVEPGDTQTVTLAVTLDNGKIDDWFRSHVRSDEQTDMEVRLRMAFQSDRLDTTFRVPRDGPATVNCDIQTAILVDDQSAKTDCGPANT
jgi:LEA14-like dessication related protein